MDRIDSIKIKKDSTFAMLLEAQRRGWTLNYLQQSDIYLIDNVPMCRCRGLQVRDDPNDWYQLDSPNDRPLASMPVILMRKDPPFNMEYIYTTYLLEMAAKDGVCVINNPASLRNFNEKLSITAFPQCCVPGIVSSDPVRIVKFLGEQGDVVVKPLDGMGGSSIFRLQKNDTNTNSILETITAHGMRTIMAQRFIPEYTQGDKRILLIDGIPVPYALARIPVAGEIRANLAAGGTAQGRELTERDSWICEQMTSFMQQNGILFAGIDVIGDYLTEINITSPTGIRELDSLFSINISSTLFDRIEENIA